MIGANNVLLFEAVYRPIRSEEVTTTIETKQLVLGKNIIR